MTNDLKNFLGAKEKIAVLVKNIRSAQYESDAIEHTEQWYNNVIDLVEKEVEKLETNGSETFADGHMQCKSEVSTILNNLRV